MNHIFVFADDYGKGVHGFKHELVKDFDSNAILRAAANEVPMVKLSKLLWFPTLIPQMKVRCSSTRPPEEIPRSTAGSACGITTP